MDASNLAVPDRVQRSLASRGGLSRSDPAYAGQAEYTTGFLRYVYDPLVLKFVNRFVWRCPTPSIVRLYDAHAGAVHLDVGPGTGYLLKRCRFPVPMPAITLLDLNLQVLATASRAIRCYRPRTYQANLLEPLDLPPESFDSIGMTHVLHCLPGSMTEKSVVLKQLRTLLRPGGRIFGTTVPGVGVAHSWWSKAWLTFLNRKGVLSNVDDDVSALEAVLRDHFPHHQLSIEGRIAAFVATA